jgi:hypothetical protein
MKAVGYSVNMKSNTLIIILNFNLKRNALLF